MANVALRWAMTVIGLLLIGYTASGLFRGRAFLIDARQADGVVVATQPGSTGGAPGHATGTTLIRFSAEDGSTIDWTSRTDGTHAVGDHVPVLYLPEQPSTAIIGSFWGTFGRFAALAVIGLVLVVVGRRASLQAMRARRYTS